MNKAVVLLSGGVDSTTVLALLKSRGYEIYGLSLDYGQKHSIELECAKKIANFYEVDHKIVKIANFPGFSSSLMALSEKPEEFEDYSKIENKIYSSYVPARNLIFLSLALSYAESIGATDIFYGPNKDDYHQYPDCREDFVKKFEELAILSTKPLEDSKAYKIHTPLIKLYKHEVVALGRKLNVDYSLTSSCYNPDADGKKCGKCLSCVVRKEAFDKNNIEDPKK